MKVLILIYILKCWSCESTGMKDFYSLKINDGRIKKPIASPWWSHSPTKVPNLVPDFLSPSASPSKIPAVDSIIPTASIMSTLPTSRIPSDETLYPFSDVNSATPSIITASPSFISTTTLTNSKKPTAFSTIAPTTTAETETPTYENQLTPFISQYTKPPIEAPTAFTLESCLLSLQNTSSGLLYGTVESIGDGWCDDNRINGASGLFQLNTAACGYDGGDCCIQSCNKNSPYYECKVSGFYCVDPQYQKQSTYSNFTIEIIGTNFTLPLNDKEVNAIFLLGLQYEMTNQGELDTYILPKVNVISTVESHFSTLSNQSVVIVDAVITTFASNSKTNSTDAYAASWWNDIRKNPNDPTMPDLRLQDTDIIPSINALPSLERSVRLASMKTNMPALSSVILCRNGIGLEECLSRGDTTTPNALVQESGTGKLICSEYSSGNWKQIYGTPTTFPGYSGIVIAYVCAWGVLGLVCAYYALQLKFLSPRESKEENELTNTQASILASQMCFRVFLYWMMTVCALLRCLYFLWLILWPDATSSEIMGSNLETENYVVCREFLFLHYRNDLAAIANASAAYQFILGCYYCLFVSTVHGVAYYEWKYFQQKQQLQNEMRDNTESGNAIPRGQNIIANRCVKQLLNLNGILILTCALATIITAGMLWNHDAQQQDSSSSTNIPAAATTTLLTIQSICGFVLCLCLAPIFWILSIMASELQSLGNESFSYRILGSQVLLMGIFALLSAHVTILQHPLSAFIVYSLVPRLLEIVFLVTVIKRLGDHTNQSLTTALREPPKQDISSKRKTTKHARPPSPFPRQELKQLRLPQVPNFSLQSQNKSHHNKGSSDLAKSDKVVSDRFIDMESQLYPMWIRTWRDEATDINGEETLADNDIGVDQDSMQAAPMIPEYDKGIKDDKVAGQQQVAKELILTNKDRAHSYRTF